MRKNLSFLLVVLSSLFLAHHVLAAERPVLTIGDVRDRSSSRMDGENQLGLWQYLEDQRGVEIQFIYLPGDTYNDALASGNLPDIMSTNNNLAAILENGLALNVDPYLEEYVPNFLQGDAGIAYHVFKQFLNEEDAFYFFPQKIGYNGVGFSNDPSNRGYVVRWDYYKELGYPPINSAEDYLNVLEQMYENHPFTEEGYPTYLFGTNNFSGYATAFRAEVSLDYWVAFKYQNNIFTNEVFDGYTDPAHSMWWTSMEWLNTLYRVGKENGSFDMDLFAQSDQQYRSKCTRGQYLGLMNGFGEFYAEKVKTDPDTLSGYGKVPSAADNLYTNACQLLGNGSAYMWFISANSSHKEAALKLFNYMCDPYFLREAMMGEQGVTWDYDAEGVPRMTDYGRDEWEAYSSGKASEENYYVRWGSYRELSSDWPLLRDNVIHPDGYPLDFLTISREYAISHMTNNISKDICSHYGVELPTDAHYKAGGLDFRNDGGEAITSCLSSLDRNQLHILANAEAILKDVYVDLILAGTDEEWNRLQEETIRRLTELGEPEVFEAYRRKWDAAAAVIVPMIRQTQIAHGIEPYTPEQYKGHP